MAERRSPGRQGLAPGSVVAGKYRVERPLGRGGVGIVVEAVEIASGRPLALKILGPQGAENATAVERFIREARATANLESEHVVRTLEVGSLPGGGPFIAMERLAGEDLGALLARRGALPAHEAASYLAQACRGLAGAHAAGVVHRDLKPANLFLTHRADGSPCLKVMDFGLSKHLRLPDDETELTQTNTILGSPAYMSPEQIRSARDVDPRADVWSLGVVLFQLVTGHLPFEHQLTAEMVVRILTADPPLPSSLREGLPTALDAVVARCLAKDREARFQTVEELGAALAPFVPASLLVAPAELPPASLPAATERRRPRVLWLAMGLVLLLAGAAAAFVAAR